MTKVAILWHMHQPFYEDLATREHILPWVRLHALKDYYGMVALLREFPGVKVTFNLVPSLLVQLEAFAEGRARDRYLELSLKPAADLLPSDVEFILDNFFHAQRQRMIDIYPRYAELLARRGGSLPTQADKRAAARRFTADDLRDLQVWHKLAWMDPFYLDGDARIRGLVQKGSRYTEDDKALLGRVELELLQRVVPEYREAAGRGQIEISTSPFYHPNHAAPLRHGRVSPHAPRLADAAPAFRPSRGCDGATRTGGGVPRTAVRPPADWACGRPKARSRTKSCLSSPGPASAGWRPTS